MTMSPDLAAWQSANDAWLGAAVEWLRLLLGHHAAPAASVVIPTDATPLGSAESPAWWRFGRRASDATTSAAPPPPLALPPASTEVPQQQVDDAASRMAALESADPPPAFLLLARRLGLSRFELNVLLLAVAMELDTRIAGLCARAHGDASLAYPTFALAFAIFEHSLPEGQREPHWDARSPHGTLRYWRLIEAQQSWAQPLIMSALRADERAVNFAKGLGELDERVAPYVTVVESARVPLPASQAAVVDRIVDELTREAPRLRPVHLLGVDSE